MRFFLQNLRHYYVTNIFLANMNGFCLVSFIDFYKGVKIIFFLCSKLVCLPYFEAHFGQERSIFF